MDSIVCKSCGGALQKLDETTYRCMFCGTAHRLTLDDSQSVRALLERNNQRWVYMNKRMEAFFDAINRACGHRTRLRVQGRQMLFVNGTLVAILVALGIAFANSLQVRPRALGVADALPFLAVGGFLLVVDLLMWFGRRFSRMRMQAALAEAGTVATDILATYRQMSDKPGRELLGSLHDSRKLAGDDAEKLAFSVYDTVTAAPPAAPG